MTVGLARVGRLVGSAVKPYRRAKISGLIYPYDQPVVFVLEKINCRYLILETPMLNPQPAETAGRGICRTCRRGPESVCHVVGESAGDDTDE